MAKEKVSKVIPVAKRIIEFDSKDIRRNPVITQSSENSISDEDWKNFAKNALVMINDSDIVQYAEEHPIVRYQCDELVAKYLVGESRLNSFVKKITVANALYGKKIGFGTGNVSCEKIVFDKVIYYQDNVGINHAINKKDIWALLLEEPNLVVSPEGLLVIFTENEILATVDCNEYCCVDCYDMNLGNRKIKNIEVCDDFCKVILLDGANVEYTYRLNFKFDITAQHPIYFEAYKL